MGADGAEAPGRLAKSWYRLLWRAAHALRVLSGNARCGGPTPQRLRRQLDALSDCRGPHVFDAEDVRLVLEYLEANERARLAEHEAYNRLCEQAATD